MEVYVLDVDSLRWKMLPAPTDFTSDICMSDVPYHRYGHSAVAWKNYAYIWGGRNDLAGACNTLYCFDTEKTTWTRPKTHGRCPDKRDGHSAAILEDTMYIFGKHRIFHKLNTVVSETDDPSLPIFHIPAYKNVLVYRYGRYSGSCTLFAFWASRSRTCIPEYDSVRL